MGFSNSNELFANSNEILSNVETMKKSAWLVTQLKISIRAKHAPPANPFATRKLPQFKSTEPPQLLKRIVQPLHCSQASKLSISGPLLHVAQAL